MPGYTDRPPLLPLMVRAISALFGDTVLAIQIPAVLCAGITVTLGGIITAALGGRGRAQLLTALGLGTSTAVLSVGHVWPALPSQGRGPCYADGRPLRVIRYA